MAGMYVNEWMSRWVTDWDPSIKQRQEDRERGRKMENKKTDRCKEKIAHSWEQPCVVSLMWLELKSAVTLVCLNASERPNEWARADDRGNSAGVQSKRKFDSDPAAKIGMSHSTTHLHCPNTKTWTGSLSKLPPCPLQQVQPLLDEKTEKKSVWARQQTNHQRQSKQKESGKGNWVGTERQRKRR